MAQSLSYIDTVRNARMTAVGDAIDGGTGAGKLRIYDGTRPADADTAITSQNLLAELPLSDPCLASVTGGVATFDTITDEASAVGSGTATWFRIVDGDDNAIVDGNVGTSGADLNLSSVSITAGGVVSVTSLVWTEGNAS